MDDEEPRSAGRLVAVLAVLIGSAVLLVSYGIGYDNLFIVLFFAYFFLSALVLRRGSPEGQAPVDKDGDDWGFDAKQKDRPAKDDDWGFDFGDDKDEEYKSLLRKAAEEKDPYADNYYE